MIREEKQNIGWHDPLKNALDFFRLIVGSLLHPSLINPRLDYLPDSQTVRGHSFSDRLRIRLLDYQPTIIEATSLQSFLTETAFRSFDFVC